MALLTYLTLQSDAVTLNVTLHRTNRPEKDAAVQNLKI